MRERLDALRDDLRFAARGLVRRPVFAFVAILTLAVGIGANTAIYSAIDALLLRALPFREPERLMDVALVPPEENAAPWSYPKYLFYRDHQKSFATLAVHTTTPAILTGTDPERITIEAVSADYLATLGVRPATGVDFPREVDAGPNARRVALISDGLWRRRFGMDPRVAGQVLHLDDKSYEIIGVLPRAFAGLSGRAEALVPVTVQTADELGEPWSLTYSLIGRLANAVSPDQAASEARPLDSIRVATALRRSLLVLFAAVAMVLLIACVNLANLLIGRTASRRREIAVRLAIGASRGRLIRLLLTESLMLAALGGAASLAVAWWGARWLSVLNPQETLRVQGLNGIIGAAGFETIHLDMRAFAFTFLVTTAAGVLFGVVPALHATRADLTADLKEGSAGAGRRVGASRRALVIAEMALALVLLAGSGLMIRSLGNLLAVDPGFSAVDVLSLRLSVADGGASPDSLAGLYDEVQEAIAALPGVQQVALADCPPLNNGCNGTIMTFADRPRTSTGNAMVGVHWVTPSWFGTMRVPLRRGRLFTKADREGGPKVVLINEEAARKYFPGEDPIGKRVAVYQGGFHAGAEVIGVVGDVRFGTIDSTARPDTYLSYGQSRTSRMTIFVRTAGDPSALAPSVRNAVRRVAPRDPIYDIRPMTARVATASAQARFSATLLAAFAAVALLLAVMGIYGVLSFAVAQRTREIGIRMALGADRASVRRLVVREGALLAAVGVTLGLALAVALTQFLRTMLFGVAPTDPATYVVMVAVLGGAALLASWIPARAAAKVDPVVALRRE